MYVLATKLWHTYVFFNLESEYLGFKIMDLIKSKYFLLIEWFWLKISEIDVNWFAVVSRIRNTASAPKYWMNSGQAFAADSVFEKN